ncbi:sigma-70 family RNA polymerase sigma factor [Viridibacillus arvi]|uniref:sigma-70 family RNA polymerase sigma factor n=1 Tax=Viridibacillus arvi TaxID=263475 RepID=UPI0036F0E3EF
MEKEERNRQLQLAMDLYGKYLVRLAYTYVKDESKAEDLVQEAFIQYYIHLEDFEAKSSVKTYLYRITVNICRNYLKSWSYRKLEWTETISKWLPTSDGPEQRAIMKETSSEVSALLSKLTPKYREVLWLYYLEGFSIQEVGRILECKENTVKTRLARGRRLAKTTFEEGVLDEN